MEVIHVNQMRLFFLGCLLSHLMEIELIKIKKALLQSYKIRL